MSFFDAPEPPEAGDPPPRPWWEPPAAEIGVPVLPDVRLLTTGAVAVAVRNLAAYTTGFSFVLVQRLTDAVRAEPFHRLHPRRRSPLPDDAFRFGLEFADGRRGTIFDSPSGGSEPGDRIALLGRGGSSSRGGADLQYWAAPLPPSGLLAFVCEWPSEGVPLTRVEIDAAGLIEAAGRG